MKKKLNILIMLILASIVSINLYVFADVGNFETYSYDDYDYDDDDDYSYDSDSSWSSGSSSSSSHSSSSGSGSYEYTPTSFAAYIFEVVFILLVFVFMFYCFTRSNRSVINRANRPTTYNRVIRKTIVNLNVDEDGIVNEIRQVDENFSIEEFKSWARDLFIKLQDSWTKRDWSVIRCFETNQLFEQHSTQLQGYIDNKQINVLEGVAVNWVKLLKFEQSGDKEILSVVLSSKMIDYIIDEETKELIKGDKNTVIINAYKLTFIRKKGVKTNLGEDTVNTTNCPNCGAPTKITSSGQCEYCGSVITTGEYNWVLSNLEPYI